MIDPLVGRCLGPAPDGLVLLLERRGGRPPAPGGPDDRDWVVVGGPWLRPTGATIEECIAARPYRRQCRYRLYRLLALSERGAPANDTPGQT